MRQKTLCQLWYLSYKGTNSSRLPHHIPNTHQMRKAQVESLGQATGEVNRSIFLFSCLVSSCLLMFRDPP